MRAGGLSRDYQAGVLFLTYSTLVSSGGRGRQTRYEQIVEWLGGAAFDGALVFDECHKCAAALTARCFVVKGPCACRWRRLDSSALSRA